MSEGEWQFYHAESLAARDSIMKTQVFMEFRESWMAQNRSMVILFRYPMRVVADYDHIPLAYNNQNYVDQGFSVLIRDYQCGERSYDGHLGTDINIWPFFWHMMERNYVQAVAAAPGVVSVVVTGNNNEYNCSFPCPIGTQNNRISITHADGSITRYLHLRTNSAMVAVGDEVVEGQPIANIGSSGCSSNPHLHFEVIDPDGYLIDPFMGACNDLNDQTWWQNQWSYQDPRIMRVMTHWTNPSLTGYNGNNEFCPGGENIRSRNQFNPGDSVHIGIALHTPELNDSVDVRVYRPNGTLDWSDTFVCLWEDYINLYHVFPYVLPGNAPSGTYRVRVNYRGVIYNHWFTVSCISNYNLSGALPFHHGYIASNSITNSGQTSAGGSTAFYQSAGTITFTPGFRANQGVSLKARIKSCGYTD